MDYFRQRRQNRQQKPHPPGKLSNARHSFVNVMFYCILHDTAVDGVEVPDEAAKRVSSRQASTLSLDPLNANRRCNWRTQSSSVSAPDSASISGCSREKDLENKKSSGKKSWLPWSKMSNKSDSHRRASSSDERKNLKHDQKCCSVPEWGLPGTHHMMVDQRRAVKCSFEGIQDLEWVDSPGSSGIVSNGDGSLSGSAGDGEPWTSSRASRKYDRKTEDVEKKSGKGKTMNEDVPSADSWTSNGGPKKVHPQQSAKTEKKDSKSPVSDRLDVVPGGTIPDVYELIKRTLNMGVPKSTPVAPPMKEALETAGHTSVKADKQKEKRDPDIPWTKTPSLHRLHTEWDEDIINIEVLLGLKKPKNSREALAVMKALGPDATTSSADDGGQSVAPDNSTGVSTSTDIQVSLNEDSKPAVEDVDSGVASRRASETTN